MGHYQKLYEKIKNNPHNVKFEEIDKLLTSIGGFERRNTGGSHYIYTHPDLPDITDHVNIPFKKPTIKPFYIKRALQMFNLVNDSFVD